MNHNLIRVTTTYMALLASLLFISDVQLAVSGEPANDWLYPAGQPGSKGPATEQLQPGYHAYTQGNFELAVTRYTQVIDSGQLRTRKQRAEALVFRGRAYSQAGRFTLALQDFSESIRLLPKYTKAYISRGKLFRNQGDYKKAIADFNRAIARHPGQARFYLIRSHTHWLEGDMDAALADAETAIQLEPYAAGGYFMRGKFHAVLRHGKQAVKDFSKAIELEPELDHAYSQRASIRNQGGDLHGALNDFDSAIRINPYRTDYFSKRGLIHARLGNAAAAEADYMRSRQLDPQDPVVYFHRGRALQVLKENDTALEQYDHAIRLAPGYANAYCWRAIIHRKNGDGKKAAADANRGLREGPSTEVCRRVMRSLEHAGD